MFDHGLKRFPLTARFNERLEDYKHKQQRELEELRFKINSLMDRTTKLHQREFDVLPEAWSKLVMAHGHVQSVAAGLQQYPDLDRMTPEQLSEFLEKCPLDRWEKERVKTESQKTDYYTRAIDYHKAWEARKTYVDFYQYYRKNSIFIRDEIKAKFDTLSELTNGALVEHELWLSDRRNFNIWDSRRKLGTEGAPLLKGLEQDVQERLWDSQSS
ncbi:hypothetical protein [Bradyrhizobium elkanii]|uniref:hypothetical protein n=1 Tax=Bradyrhizobium elkanii TaxID=29448 RepID=UPI00056EA856|nr:hypothetical protein [Bradyrhizobium elkanii]WLA79248.1 hypothetical protein QNJ99_27990 [Bradyrhizobium elkanii]